MSRNVPAQPKNPSNRSSLVTNAEHEARERQNAIRRFRAYEREQGIWHTRALKFEADETIQTIDGFTPEYTMQQFDRLENEMYKLENKFAGIRKEALNGSR